MLDLVTSTSLGMNILFIIILVTLLIQSGRGHGRQTNSLVHLFQRQAQNQTTPAEVVVVLPPPMDTPSRELPLNSDVDMTSAVTESVKKRKHLHSTPTGMDSVLEENRCWEESAYGVVRELPGTFLPFMHKYLTACYIHLKLHGNTQNGFDFGLLSLHILNNPELRTHFFCLEPDVKANIIRALLDNSYKPKVVLNEQQYWNHIKVAANGGPRKFPLHISQGPLVTYSVWLAYSPYVNGAFCKYCVLNALLEYNQMVCAIPLVGTAWKNLAHVTRTLEAHETGELHKISHERVVAILRNNIRTLDNVLLQQSIASRVSTILLYIYIYIYKYYYIYSTHFLNIKLHRICILVQKRTRLQVFEAVYTE